MSEPLTVDATTRIRREAQRQVTDRVALHEILDEAVVAHVGVVRDGLPLDRASVKVAAPDVPPGSALPASVERLLRARAPGRSR